jgi:DNA polymerase I-like protein with 3'-5' exonuclease and polymerase domains
MDALTYIIQSTSSDLFLRKMIAIDKILKDRKTFISFSIHDSLVLDFSSEDNDILAKIVQEFSDTDLGKFKVNVKYGKNFKNMLIV